MISDFGSIHIIFCQLGNLPDPGSGFLDFADFFVFGCFCSGSQFRMDAELFLKSDQVPHGFFRMTEVGRPKGSCKNFVTRGGSAKR